MIEQHIFDERFQVIAAHYGYEVNSPVSKVYYNYLSENLNTEEFLEATKKAIIRFPVRMKLPSPQEIVEIIFGSREAMALQEWRMIVEASKQTSKSEALTYLSKRGHIALASIGGLYVVAYEEGPLTWIQKSFTQVYCESSADGKILKQAPVANPRQTPAPAPPPADEELIKPEQWAEAKARMQKLGIWKSNR